MRRIDFSNDRLGLLYGLTIGQEDMAHASLPSFINSAGRQGSQSKSEQRERKEERRRMEKQKEREIEAMWRDYEQEDLEKNLARTERSKSVEQGNQKEAREGISCDWDRFPKRRKFDDVDSNLERAVNSDANVADTEKMATDLHSRTAAGDGEPTAKESYAKPKSGKFRFKKRRLKRDEDGYRRSEHYDDKNDTKKSRDTHNIGHSSHQFSSFKKRKKVEVELEGKGYTEYETLNPDNPAAYDDSYLPNASSHQYPDPDTAFRQSLFDAMADDEGAIFWESVYGQRIDIYPPPLHGLNSMTDEEYAAYVRQKMYEKTHEHITIEKEKREQRRKEEKERKEWEAKEWERLEKERVTKDRTRRDKKERDKLEKRWNVYLGKWAQASTTVKEGVPLEEAIPWPVETGRLSEVSRSELERFYLSSPQAVEGGLRDLLKTERVKWHPDKIQQRWGKLDGSVLTTVNTIFQTLDSMWLEQNKKNGETSS